jgi:acyl carrier protein
MTPLSEEQLRALVLEELHKIAPDVDTAALDPTGDLREEADIDSMDFLNLLVAVGKRTGVEIPDKDAGALTSVSALAGYLAKRGGASR